MSADALADAMTRIAGTALPVSLAVYGLHRGWSLLRRIVAEPAPYEGRHDELHVVLKEDPPRMPAPVERSIYATLETETQRRRDAMAAFVEQERRVEADRHGLPHAPAPVDGPSVPNIVSGYRATMAVGNLGHSRACKTCGGRERT